MGTVVLATSIIAARAQTQPNATEILGMVNRAYDHLAQYDLTAVTTTLDANGASKEISRVRIVADGPKRLRVRREPEGAQPEGVIWRTLVIADGQYLWVYSASHNQYIKSELPDSLDFFKSPVLWFNRRAPSPLGLQDLLPDETIDVGGQKIECYVLRHAPLRAANVIHTWWIDKKRYVVYRDEMLTKYANTSEIWTTNWEITTLKEPVAPELFVFAPPLGSRRVEKFDP